MTYNGYNDFLTERDFPWIYYETWSFEKKDQCLIPLTVWQNFIWVQSNVFWISYNRMAYFWTSSNTKLAILTQEHVVLNT